MSQIFNGIRILDFTKVFSAPFATRMFADYGAEVIKIENSKSPDEARFFPPRKGEWSGYFEILNRNKKGIALDLTNPEELDILYDLVKQSDVFVENMSPQTKYKLKIDYEILRKINSSIIYASLSGLGENSTKKYYDIIAQAESGLMSLTGTPESAMKIGPSVVDAFCGMTLAFAISSALYSREKTGGGQAINVSMKGAAMNLLESNLTEYSLTKENPSRTGNKDNLIAPFGVYMAHGKQVVVAIGNENLWGKFLEIARTCNITYDNELFISNEKRLENSEELTNFVQSVLNSLPEETLVEMLTELGIPASYVYSMAQVYDEKDNYDREFLKKINYPDIGEFVVPGKSIIFSNEKNIEYKRAPKVGENNKEYGI